MKTNDLPYRLLGMLCCLTLLFIGWQVAFFGIHYHVSDLIDSFANASISKEFFHIAILLPIFVYIIIQICSYALIITWTYFIATSIGHFFNLRPVMTYWFGIACLAFGLADVMAMNSYYFPFSFFANHSLGYYFLLVSALFWVVVSVLSYMDCFVGLRPSRNDGILGWLFIAILAINVFCALPSFNRAPTSLSSQPNIIIIGLDSLRPDYTGFYGNQQVRTPTHLSKLDEHIDS